METLGLEWRIIINRAGGRAIHYTMINRAGGRAIHYTIINRAGGRPIHLSDFG